MDFISFERAAERFQGKTVAIVGSGPGSLDNSPGFVDSHDIVIRINNFKIGKAQGMRVDAHYSFYGVSIRTDRAALMDAGCKLCMCKCPNSKPIQSEWHERNGKQVGIDFRYIYRNRESWWFCDTFIPDDAHFLRAFEMLGGHIPTTGFAAILDVLACDPTSVYLTGFDFFSSGVHNVDELWRAGNSGDPIGHRPDLEVAWLKASAGKHPLAFDKRLMEILA